jgi:hypothetical protein
MLSLEIELTEIRSGSLGIPEMLMQQHFWIPGEFFYAVRKINHFLRHFVDVS